MTLYLYIYKRFSIRTRIHIIGSFMGLSCYSCRLPSIITKYTLNYCILTAYRNREVCHLLFILLLDCFSKLMASLKLCPSATANLPQPGEGMVNKSALEPEHRVLVALRFLASPDLIASIAVA